MIDLKEIMSARRRDHLLERRTRAVATAPELAEILRGTLGRRYICCGKAGCWCRTERGHGPVRYLSVSLGVGRTHQVTVPREAYAIAQRYVQNYARLRRSLETISTVNRTLLQLRLLAAPSKTRRSRSRSKRRGPREKPR